MVFLVLSLLPATFALLAIIVGSERFVDDAATNVALDNNYRYLGGIYLAVSLLALWSVREIEDRVDALTFATGAIFLGAFGRLVSIAELGVPSGTTWVVLAVELSALPLAMTFRRSLHASSHSG